MTYVQITYPNKAADAVLVKPEVVTYAPRHNGLLVAISVSNTTWLRKLS